MRRSSHLRAQDNRGNWQPWRGITGLTVRTLITLGFIAWLIQNNLINLASL